MTEMQIFAGLDQHDLITEAIRSRKMVGEHKHFLHLSIADVTFQCEFQVVRLDQELKAQNYE
jgi:hypothetical protein